MKRKPRQNVRQRQKERASRRTLSLLLFLFMAAGTLTARTAAKTVPGSLGEEPNVAQVEGPVVILEEPGFVQPEGQAEDQAESGEDEGKAPAGAGPLGGGQLALPVRVQPEAESMASGEVTEESGREKRPHPALLREALEGPWQQELFPGLGEGIFPEAEEEQFLQDLTETLFELMYRTSDALYFLEGIQPLSQFPELPTGCEVTALATAMNYLGVPAKKEVLADLFLEKGPVGGVDFREAFSGDPREIDGFGCYAPVIVDCATRYLEYIGSGLKARDLTGTEFTDLFPYINAGVPVVIWGTRDNMEAKESVTWYVGEKELTWISPEHCMVLVGYNADTVWVSDPTYGRLRLYPLLEFKKNYEALGRQAVVLQ